MTDVGTNHLYSMVDGIYMYNTELEVGNIEVYIHQRKSPENSGPNWENPGPSDY